jgi:hypothetical protein
LLKQVSKPYHSECWAISDELAGAIAQAQKSVYRSTKQLTTKVKIKDNVGSLTVNKFLFINPNHLL